MQEAAASACPKLLRPYDAQQRQAACFFRVLNSWRNNLPIDTLMKWNGIRNATQVTQRKKIIVKKVDPNHAEKQK